MSIVQPVHSDLVEGGRFTIVVRATDGGKPALHNDVKVSVDVGSQKNRKPVFLRPSYEASVQENAPVGEKVIQVTANDPDGPDSELR